MSKKNKIRAAVIAALLGITIILGVIVFTSTTPKEPNLVDIEPLSDPEVEENQIEPTHHSEPHIEPTSTPAPIPTEGPIPTETSKLKQNYKEDPADAFSLVVGDSQIGIAYGVDETTLDESPGWMENSAFPGEDGVCVIYGHRNRNHLRALRDVEIGDTLILKTSKGNFKYTVETIEILDQNKALTIPLVDGKYLMISTCYPFHYLGSAPQKYVVIAKLT